MDGSHGEAAEKGDPGDLGEEKDGHPLPPFHAGLSSVRLLRVDEEVVHETDENGGAQKRGQKNQGEAPAGDLREKRKRRVKCFSEAARAGESGKGAIRWSAGKA